MKIYMKHSNIVFIPVREMNAENFVLSFEQHVTCEIKATKLQLKEGGMKTLREDCKVLINMSEVAYIEL